MNYLQEKYEKQIIDIVSVCHRAADLGYVTSSGGNISVRVEEDLVLITPTKTSKRIMKFDDICAVNLNGDTVFCKEGKKPTGEVPFHVHIYNKRSDLKAIVHAHPSILTGFAIAGIDLLERPFLPEPIIEVGPMLLVPYATPITEELSLKFDEVIDKTNGFLLENHGVVMCNAISVFDAMEQLQMMECMAQSIIVSKILGNCKTILKHNVEELNDTISKRNLVMPGALDYFKSTVEMYKFD